MEGRSCGFRSARLSACVRPWRSDHAEHDGRDVHAVERGIGELLESTQASMSGRVGGAPREKEGIMRSQFGYLALVTMLVLGTTTATGTQSAQSASDTFTWF